MKKKISVALLCAVLIFTACKPISDMSIINDTPAPSGAVPGDDDDGFIDAGTSELPPAEIEEPIIERRFAGLFGASEMNNPNAISAPFGALYNLTEDIFVYGKHVDELVFPSGAVRLLTALTAYETLAELPDGQDFIFSVGDEISMIGPEAGTAGLQRGQQLSLYGILTALLTTVGSDAAYSIAVNTARLMTDLDTAGDNEMNDYFIRLMNDYAQRLGTANSNFSNPCGFHANNNFSTVRDLALITAAAAENAMITDISGYSEMERTRRFLNLEGQDIRGFITAFTNESRLSAQILAYIDGNMYIVVVSGSADVDSLESDVRSLLEMAAHGHDADIISVIEG